MMGNLILFQQSGDLRAKSAPIDASRTTRVSVVEGEVLFYRQVFEEPKILMHESQTCILSSRRRVIVQIKLLAKDFKFTLVGLVHASENLDCGAFAGAIPAE